MEEQQIIDEIPRKNIRTRKKLLYSAIRDQMEFYFSDANLSKDRFIANLLQNDPYIDLSVFMSFNKIRHLTGKVSDICRAVSNSEILELSEDNLKVCRKTPVHIKENQDDCTIYVERLPVDAEHSWLNSVFSKFGQVDYVSIPKYKHNKMIKGFAFVEFDTPESALKALQYYESIGCKLPTTMLPDQLVSISTFEPEQSEKAQNFIQKFSNEMKKSENADEIVNNIKNENDENDITKTAKGKKRKEKFDEDETEMFEVKKQKKKISDEINNIQENTATTEDKVKENVNEGKKKKKQNIDCEENEERTKEKIDDTAIESSNESKKKKKERKQNTDCEKNKEEDKDKIEDNVVENLNESKKKKKERKQNTDCKEGKEEEAKDKIEDNVVENSKESKKKKKERKQNTIDEENKEDTNDKFEDNVVENLNEGKKKKKERKQNTGIDENKEEIKEQIEEHNENIKETTDQTKNEDETTEKKKRKRKRHKNNSNDIQQDGLQVLSKKEWKQLRNKYLNLQKQKMQSLKEHLYRSRFANTQNNSENNVEKKSKKSTQEENTFTEKFKYLPGVIVSLEFPDVVNDLSKLKNDIKSQAGVEYVDIQAGNITGYVRFSDSENAKKFCECESIITNKSILEGDEEKQYWDKIRDQRDAKCSKNKKKQRGRDKLLRKAEKELGKHIRFENAE